MSGQGYPAQDGDENAETRLGLAATDNSSPARRRRPTRKHARGVAVARVLAVRVLTRRKDGGDRSRTGRLGSESRRRHVRPTTPKSSNLARLFRESQGLRRSQTSRSTRPARSLRLRLNGAPACYRYQSTSAACSLYSVRGSRVHARTCGSLRATHPGGALLSCLPTGTAGL